MPAAPPGAARAPMDTGRRAGTVAAAAYLLVVGAIEVARAGGLGPSAPDLASSPAGVAAGRVWELFTSGLVVAGDPVVQLAAAAPVVALVVLLLGPAVFWRAALAGHVGATLVAYAGIGVWWLLAAGDVDAVIDAPDYGISAVWAAALGALLVGTRRRPGVVRWLAVGATAVFVVLIGFAPDLAGVEHLLAFGLGAAVTLWAGRSGSARGGSVSRA